MQEYTRYDIIQHEYAGGGPSDSGGWGYIEVLEIKNPPDNRSAIVINERSSDWSSAFSEWETLEDALMAFSKYWSSQSTNEVFPKLKGFKRRVPCGPLTPWFYAIGNEQLHGDYAFPKGLQDDPVYRFGRQFVVYTEDGIPSVKTCMGTRLLSRTQSYHPANEQHYRIVCWDDGSMWDESGDSSWWSSKYPPRPVEKSEQWITEAVQQFRELLAGKKTEFSVNFTNGNKFVGKFLNQNKEFHSAEGRYLLLVHFKNKRKAELGWVTFKPTAQDRNVTQYVTTSFAKKGIEVSRIEVKKSKTKKGGMKWAGVYFQQPN